MVAPSLRTTQLHDWLRRLRARDWAVADESLRAGCARMADALCGALPAP